MAATTTALVLAVSLMVCIAPAAADGYIPRLGRRLQQGFNIPGFTEPAGSTPNTDSPGLSPTQPGCTAQFTFSNICADCQAPAYAYTFSTGSAPVCQCGAGYARNSAGECVFASPGPAPAPVPPPAPGSIPGLPGNYGSAPGQTPIPDPVADPQGFTALLQDIIANAGNTFSSLFGGRR